MEEKTSSKLKSMLDSKKIRNIIIVVGLIGIGLIFLSNWVDFGSLTSGKGDEAFSVKTCVLSKKHSVFAGSVFHLLS